MRDLGSMLTLKRLVTEAVNTTSLTPVVIDRATVNSNLYDGMTFGFFVGAGGITFTTANYIAFKLEESDDNVNFYNVVTGETLLGTNAAAPGGQTPDANGFVRLITVAKASADTDPFKVTYIGSKRYIRSTVVFGGTHSTGTLVSLWAVLGFPGSKPPA